MIRPAATIALMMLAGCTWPGMNGGGGRSDGGTRPSIFSGAFHSDREDWEILCGSYDGSGRMRVADDLGLALKRVPQLDSKRVHVVHEEGTSRITYGPYSLGFDEQGHVVFTSEMQRDLDLIRSLSLNEQFPFFTAMKRPAPTPDIGPPEFDLRQARGVYTLQIGVFYNTPGFHQRKEAAVEWVRDLRARGYPAYFLHGPQLSHVTVGAFDAGAHLERKIKESGSEVIIPRGPNRDYRQDVIKLQQNPEFQYNHVNAAVEKVNGIPQQSFLVEIPRRQDSATVGAR